MKKEKNWWLSLIQGILYVILGVATLKWPGMTSLALLYVIAAQALVGGIFTIVIGANQEKSGKTDWLVVILGLLTSAFGIWMMVAPAKGALAVLWLIGTYGIVMGVMLIVLAIVMKGNKGAKAEVL